MKNSWQPSQSLCHNHVQITRDRLEVIQVTNFQRYQRSKRPLFMGIDNTKIASIYTLLLHQLSHFETVTVSFSWELKVTFSAKIQMQWLRLHLKKSYRAFIPPTTSVRRPKRMSTDSSKASWNDWGGDQNWKIRKADLYMYSVSVEEDLTIGRCPPETSTRSFERGLERGPQAWITHYRKNLPLEK